MGLVIKDVENEPFYMLTMSSARLGAVLLGGRETRRRTKDDNDGDEL